MKWDIKNVKDIIIYKKGFGQDVTDGRIPLPDFDQNTVDKTIYNTRSFCNCIIKYITEIWSNRKYFSIFFNNLIFLCLKEFALYNLFFCKTYLGMDWFTDED